MLKTFKKKRPKNRIKNKKSYLADNLNSKERKQELLDYKKGRYA